MNRYEQIAQVLEDKIRMGRLKIGARLPSVREMSQREETSPSTVVEAYALLQDRGWIESRDRSGFYVLPQTVIQTCPESHVESKILEEPFNLNPNDLIMALRQAAHDPKYVPFGAATPSVEFFPLKSITRSLNRALRDEPSLMADYIFPPGSSSLRHQIARRLGRNNVEIDPSEIVTTSGATEAIALSLKCLTVPGDVVLLESPTYFGILQTVQASGCRVFEIPGHPNSGLDPAKFLAATKKLGHRLKVAILVPNHSNPLGARMSAENKLEVVRIARQAKIKIIEDDVYGDLAYDQRRPRTLLSYDLKDSVILCGSFAKTIAPGLRVGYVVSRKHAGELALMRSALTCGTSTVAEEAIATYLSSGGFDRHLRKVSKEYKTLTAQFAAAILRNFPRGTRVNTPTGGYVLWVQLPNQMDSRIFQKKALEQKISIAAGTMFSAQQEHKDCFRINCAVPWSPRVERAIEKLGTIAKHLINQ